MSLSPKSLSMLFSKGGTFPSPIKSNFEGKVTLSTSSKCSQKFVDSFKMLTYFDNVELLMQDFTVSAVVPLTKYYY